MTAMAEVLDRISGYKEEIEAPRIASERKGHARLARSAPPPATALAESLRSTHRAGGLCVVAEIKKRARPRLIARCHRQVWKRLYAAGGVRASRCSPMRRLRGRRNVDGWHARRHELPGEKTVWSRHISVLGHGSGGADSPVHYHGRGRRTQRARSWQARPVSRQGSSRECMTRRSCPPLLLIRRSRPPTPRHKDLATRASRRRHLAPRCPPSEYVIGESGPIFTHADHYPACRMRGARLPRRREPERQGQTWRGDPHSAFPDPRKDRGEVAP